MDEGFWSKAEMDKARSAAVRPSKLCENCLFFGSRRRSCLSCFEPAKRVIRVFFITCMEDELYVSNEREFDNLNLVTFAAEVTRDDVSCAIDEGYVHYVSDKDEAMEYIDELVEKEQERRSSLLNKYDQLVVHVNGFPNDNDLIDILAKVIKLNPVKLTVSGTCATDACTKITASSDDTTLVSFVGDDAFANIVKFYSEFFQNYSPIPAKYT